MDRARRPGRARDFLIGGLVGASAAIATARRRRTVRRRREERVDQPAGLAAFEGAPCFDELFEQADETPSPG